MGWMQGLPLNLTLTTFTTTIVKGRPMKCVIVTLFTILLPSFIFSQPSISSSLFAPAVNYPAGTDPISIASGDLNGDSKPDIVITNKNGNTISLYRNVSTSDSIIFKPKSDITAIFNPQYVSLGDIDGDGRSDLVIVGDGNVSLSVFLNTTASSDTITFGSRILIRNQYNPSYLAIRDIDLDGKLDVSSPSNNDAKVYVYHNASTVGNVAFDTVLNFSVGGSPSGIISEEIDGDGKPDLAVVSGNGYVSVLRNISTPGTVQFQTKVDFTVGSNSQFAISEDFNGDLKYDVVALNRNSSTISVLRNTAVSGEITSSSFAAKTDFTTGSDPFTAFASDFNEDGKVDIAVTNNLGNTVSVFQNICTANTILFATKVDFTPDTKPTGITADDFDGDGDIDFAVANSQSNNMSILENILVRVKSVYPAQNRLNVPKDTVITVKFYKPMNTSTFTTGNILVYGSHSGKHTGTITLSGDTMFTFNPIVDFKVGEVVNVSLTKNILSSQGDSLTNGYLWSFLIDLESGSGIFTEAQTLNVTTAVISTLSGDIDNDGDVDLVAFDNSAFNGNVFKNNSGKFTLFSTITGLNNPAFGGMADFDNDGDIDIAIENYGNNSGTSVSIFANDGNGTFSQLTTATTGSGPQSLAIGDFNGDGYNDIAVCIYGNGSGNTLSIQLNNKNGTFTQSSTLTVGTGPRKITSGDYDGDGDIDLAVSDFTSGDIKILLNSGNGTFTVSSTLPLVNKSYGLISLDVDGDGDLDIAAQNWNQSLVSIFKNDGSGAFPLISTANSGGSGTLIASSDIDNDGDIDIICPGGGNSVTFLLNDGNGNYTSSYSKAFKTAINEAAFADFNGDGDIDFAGGNSGANTISVILHNTPTVTTVTPNQNALNVSKSTNITARFNQAMKTDSLNARTILVYGSQSGKHTGTITLSGDTMFTFNPTVDFKYGEVVTVNLSSNITNSFGDPLVNGYHWSFTVEVSGGSGLFVNSQNVNVGTPLSEITILDLNGDEFTDVVLSRYSIDSITFLLNDGFGNFSITSNISVGDSPEDFEFGDWDGDNDIDVATVNRNSNNVSILANNGSGIFSVTSTPSTGGGPVEITSGDIDGDGDIDIMTSNYANGSGSTVSTLVNDGEGNFVHVGTTYAGTDPVGLSLQDLDNDGDLDLAVVNYETGGSVTILKNEGGGSFVIVSTINVGTFPNQIKSGDIDNDGDNDLVVSNYYNPGSVSVLKNNGSGGFPYTDTLFVGHGNGPQELSLGDIDDDGDLDLAVSYQGSSTLSFLINDGGGNFTFLDSFTNYAAWAVSNFSDIDNDGDVDVLSANSYTNSVYVFKNISPGISGIKFNDLDGDGVKDSGEPGIANWKILLSGAETDSTYTDANGNYSFTGLINGSYTVSEESKSNWVQTFPGSGTYILTYSGSALEGKDFGNFKRSSISGQKFKDINSDGIKNGLDSGLANWRIRLTKNSVQIDSALTDASGHYSFTNLTPGTYVVSEKLEVNWVQTLPVSPGTYTLTIVSGDSLLGKDFGNHSEIDNSITIRKFRDGDGDFNTRNDLTTKAWKLRLYRDSISTSTLLDSTESSVLTVINLTPDKYIAVEADSSVTGWFSIGKIVNDVPTAGTFLTDTIILGASETHRVDFVNYHPNTIIVRKFEDRDGIFATISDRVRKVWQLSLHTDGPYGPVIASANAESLIVSGLADGSYAVRESDSSGWFHLGRIYGAYSDSLDLNSYDPINVTGGETRIIDFVNYNPGSILITKWLDQDGDYRTNEGSQIPWNFKLYRIVDNETTLVKATEEPAVEFFVPELPQGVYRVVEQDTAHPWSHIGTIVYKNSVPIRNTGGMENYINITIDGGESWHTRFINFNRNRVKYWTDSTGNCLWSDGNNWRPPGVPIPGDSIVVDTSAQCPLVIPGCQTIGSIYITGPETLRVAAGTSLYINGDATFDGTFLADTSDSSTIHLCGNLSIGAGWRAGKSHIIFVGQNNQKINGNGKNFFKIKIGGGNCPSCDSANVLISNSPPENPSPYARVQTESSFEVTEQLTLENDLDAGGDTIFVLNENSSSVAGTGKLIKGTMKRMIQSGSTSRYRFESDSSYVNFVSGTNPSSVSMTVYPDTTADNFGTEWLVVPSTVDTATNTIYAEGVTQFSKWAFGRSRRSLSSPTADTLGDPDVKRVYVLNATGGSFTSRLALRYEQSEVPNGVPEDSLVLLRLADEVEFTDSVNARWNMISLPVFVSNNNVSAVFPTSVSNTLNAFVPGSGYEQRSVLENGIGYWLKFPSAQSVTISGSERTSTTVDVSQGWNMVGALSSPITSASVTSIPSGIIAGTFFGFNNGYYPTDTLEPLRGYWIKVSNDGQLVMNTSAFSKSATVENLFNKFNKLLLRDAEGFEQTLYFGIHEGIDERWYELPPPSPEPSFRAKFGNNSLLTTTMNGVVKEMPIYLSAPKYPLTLKWNIVNAGLSASLKLDTKVIPMRNHGSMIVPSSQSRMTLSFEGTSDIPKEFGLEQNYPNPFNPVTVIRYQLPVQSKVTLKIYNVLGQVVSTLVDEVQDAGYKLSEWNSSGAASSVYFYRLEAAATSNPSNTYVKVRKMLLLK
jgi:hypothetical protein